MKDLKNQNECNYCEDYGYIYTCLNCIEPAIYDSDYGIAICDTCFLLGEEQNIDSEKCSHCDIANREFEVLKIGELIEFPTEKKINQVINWAYLLKIYHQDSYELIRPIELISSKLNCFSYIENTTKDIDLNILKNSTVEDRNPYLISWSTSLKGLIDYLKEERNKNLLNKFSYVRLLFVKGFSWDMHNASQNDVFNRINFKDNLFSNGVTFKISYLLNSTTLKINSLENYFFDKENNLLYYIESIRKFEVF